MNLTLGKPLIAVPVVLFAVGLAIYVFDRLRGKPREVNELGIPIHTVVSAEPDTPVAFGYKCAWLAIKTEDTGAVVAALPLEKTQPGNWKTGIDIAYEGKVFVSPPVRGWTLVVGGAYLPEAAQDPDEDRCTPWLVRLSGQFGEVQYFGTHRVVEYHAWAKVVAGAVVRA